MEMSQSQKLISAEAAHRAVGAAVAKAEELGIRINVAVVDSAGNDAAFLRMPGAFLHSIGIARDKAYTAAGFGLPTDELYELVKQPPALRDGILARPRLVAFGGGLPIYDGDAVIGAVGVSGGSEDQDRLCAQAALDALAT